MSRDDDSLISRWSRRKRAVAEEEAERVEKGAPVPEQVEANPPPETDHEEETEEATLARLNLPSPESLGPGDDFSGFMQSGVPEHLRRRALRRLWRSNPVLANLDGLNDYDEDFTSAEETGKILQSAYKIGRGFLRDDAEEEANREPVEEVSEEPSEDADFSDDSGKENQQEDPTQTEAVAEVQSDPEVTAQNPNETTPKRPRRMRFDS